ncbi:hypothetical protein AC792_07040 [Arthrobacter sp. RIT-PI-e]|uniref:DUF1206 domain-containing protein n=1 Tax=Arthrobacter sp. RIT-PI-e TaxID=1681197 RepID=UPI000676AF07|nr:DUF1206 domain-containing protein [Arthrobacter sp. RIT-PI-e]KNC19377.1 hypothetical protein AC792_07040 [Arthrobacter sp. RIT-PI-e]
MGQGTTPGGGGKDAVDKATDAAEQAADSTGFTLAARAGYVAAGILHLLIGIIALGLSDGGSGSADQSGAIGQLATRPGGTVLLWFCFLGCLALALFLVSEIFFGARSGSAKDRAVFRTKCAGQSVVYAGIGVTFGRFALGGSTDSSSSTSSVSASLMSHPAGSVLLFAVGLGILGVGGYFIHSGVTRRFRKHLTRLPLRPAGTALVALGAVGYIAKGVALGVLGVLVLVSTVRHDPEQSTGLDGALKSLRDQPFGMWILGSVALGLMAYGVFMVIRSRYQRM